MTPLEKLVADLEKTTTQECWPPHIQGAFCERCYLRRALAEYREAVAAQPPEAGEACKLCDWALLPHPCPTCPDPAAFRRKKESAGGDRP